MLKLNEMLKNPAREYHYSRQPFVFNNYLSMVVLGIMLALLSNQAHAQMINVDEMLKNLRDQIGPLTLFVTGFCYLTGMFFIFKAVYVLKQYGEMRTMMASQTDLRGPIGSIAIGACLIFTPTIIKISLTTVFGSNSPAEYNPTGSVWDEMGETLVLIVQFVGGVAFVRGLMHFHKLGQGQAQPGTFGKAVIHVIGGIIALNIVGASHVLWTTLGADPF